MCVGILANEFLGFSLGGNRLLGSCERVFAKGGLVGRPTKWPPPVPVAFYVTDVVLELEFSVPVYFNSVSY